ncbi:putative O-methyltransferase [Rhizodiscina lignyota]|uniref:O-methyltransferase n=1 Tax=Rhizodiscina lignyota TaxID=1504668 RepID=A0A9P4MCF7_9PEZI|nr:putative O-methyltransferase [Rhizodiscina lignyota]
MAGPQPTLLELSSKISEIARSMSSYMETKNWPAPSFAASSVESYPQAPELHSARMMLIETLMDMLHLAISPSEFLFWHALTTKHDVMVLDVLNQFDFFSAVPIDGSASYTGIAAYTKLPESVVRRILRQAFTLHLFAETFPGSGYVVHTAATAYTVRQPLVRSWIALNTEEVGKGCVTMPEALKAYSFGKEQITQKPGECGVARAFYNRDGRPDLADKTYYHWAEEDGEDGQRGWRERRFGEAMQALGKQNTVTPEQILGGVDWGALGDATVVDVGGSVGHLSHILANSYPNLKCIVQDVPGLEPQFNAALPAELSSRITFKAHDFFSPQLVVADVYFFKNVFLNWQDDYAIRILRALLPSLKPGARIVVYDPIMPPVANEEGKRAVPLPVERLMTSMDLQMLVVCNGIDRTIEDWVKLFKKADERFCLKGVSMPKGSPFGLLEVTFEHRTPSLED